MARIRSRSGRNHHESSRRRPLSAVVVLFAGTTAAAQGKLNVVTSTEDLASIAREVGGDKVNVTALGTGLPGSAFRRAEAELHPGDESRGSVHRGRPRAGDWLAAAAVDQQPQREDPAGRRGLSRRLAERPHPRDSNRPDHARDGRRAPARQSALLARAGQRAADRPGRSQQAERAGARPTRRILRSATTTSTSVWPPPRSAGTRRWLPIKGTKVVTYHRSWPNFMERFGLEVDRLRRTEAGHSTLPVAHARPHRGDEAQRHQAHRRRAVFQPEDAAGDRQPGPGGKVLVLAPSVGGVKEVTDYIQLVRIQRQSAGGRAEAGHRKVGRTWTGRSFSSWRLRSSRA